MILFYAWTDTQIINVVNLKCNRFQKQEADLLVYKLGRVSSTLIAEIEKKKIFCQVYILDVPEFYLERKRKGFKEKVQAVFLGKQYRYYFDKELQKLLGIKQYSLFFSGAFWSETLFVFQYVKQQNPKIRFWFYDEGLAAYNGPKNWLFQAVPNRSVQAKIRTVLYYGFTSVMYRKYVDGIYLYKPELSNVTYLPKYDFFASKKVNLFIPEHEKTDVYWKDIYKECDVIYIAEAPDLSSRFPLEDTYRVLEEVYKIMPMAKVVLKAHPIMESIGIDFEKDVFPNLVIDKRNGAIEILLHQVDIDKKIMITGNSTSALYLKWVYGKTPYMILVDRKYNQRLFEYAQCYVKKYDAEKAFAPKNIEEFRKELKKLLLVNRRKQ